MRSFISLYIATVREFWRDLSALFWTLAFPIMFIVIFGVIFSGSDDISFDLGLVNEDGEASAPLVNGFKQVGVFDVSEGSREDELESLKDGDRDVVIVIPAGTGAAFRPVELAENPSHSAESATALQVYYDPADQSSSQVVLNIVDKVVTEMNQQITGLEPVITTEEKSVTAQDLKVLDYLLPGVLAMSLMQMGLFGTAGPLVALREKQVLRRMGATPLRRTTLLLTQVAFRLSTAMVQMVLIIGLGVLVFDVHMKFENLPAIIGLVMLGGTMFITLGYFISGLAKTEEAVQGIISLPNFIFMFLSGIFFEVEFMPKWIRPVVDAIPLTYLGDALRKTMIDAGSYYPMGRSVAILVGWLVVCAVLAVRFFKWEPQA